MSDRAKNVGIFVAKTFFYTTIILILLYLYHYKGFSGGGFIYNEF
ncbi:MAG: teichoic acid D-Ala incorporation-associated protein DltX [Lactobacillales bacterium]|nr:teichoic acid D-Ala incorporation-associated protein DltX [Lactobacillales bacterium]MDR3156610.1 teichoic acid D-Ala incorporation-associated protein DltX [Lactobacillales bacterium]